MADVIANIAKGRVAYYASLPAANDALIMILLKTGDTDANLRDFDDVAAMIAGPAVEADFTGYTRKTLTNVVVTVDDANDRVEIQCDPVVYNPAGGATNNTLARICIAYDPDTTTGTDSTLVPISYHDFTPTTDGTQLTISPPADGEGFIWAS